MGRWNILMATGLLSLMSRNSQVSAAVPLPNSRRAWCVPPCKNRSRAYIQPLECPYKKYELNKLYLLRSTSTPLDQSVPEERWC